MSLHSDPYTRLSLYDPVNGEITSLQTKTIKKVTKTTFSTFAVTPVFDLLTHTCLLTFFLSLLMKPEDIGPKMERRILFQSKCKHFKIDIFFISQSEQDTGFIYFLLYKM